MLSCTCVRRQESNKAMLQRITDLINDVITTKDPSARLSPQDVIDLIGEPHSIQAVRDAL